MAAEEQFVPPGQAEEEELEALRLLCASLARLFSYPDAATAAAFTNSESVAYLVALTEQARLAEEELSPAAEAAAAAAASAPDDERARAMRLTFTRLFYCPDAPIPLEGRHWIRREPDEPERALGEEAAVARYFRASGVAVRKGVVERACALTSELDFAAYVLERELFFSHAGDGAQALLWKRRRVRFVQRHLGELAREVSAGILAQADWPPLRYWALLLVAVVRRCSY